MNERDQTVVDFVGSGVMDSWGVPPPPQKIFEHLNGHLIGHYIMKKAISVAVYNHFCDVGMKRKLAHGGPENQRSALELMSEMYPHDQKTYRHHDNNSQAEIDQTGHNNFSRDYFETADTMKKNGEIKTRKGSNDSGIEGGSPPKTGAYLTPVVARVIIEASSHRVHLRKPNTLTFDSTGSSRPLDSIATHLARYLEVPYVRCDCKLLVPTKKISKLKHQNNSNPHLDQNNFLSSSNPHGRTMTNCSQMHGYKRRRSLQPGTLSRLLEGYVGETLETVVAKLFKNSGYDVDKTERGIIFLDAMHQLGSQGLAAIDDDDNEGMDARRKQIFQEIMDLISGTEVVVRKPKMPHTICEKAGELPKLDDQNEFVKIRTGHMFFICFGVNDGEIEKTESDGSSKEGKVALSSSTKSMAINTKNNLHSFSTNHPSKDESFITEEDELFDEDDYEYEEDESFVGLTENKLAKMLLVAKNSPIPQCQNLWGMEDIELKITPEAMEIIANQATQQHAGVDGVRTILEKLLFTVKFDIPGKNVKSVEITEDFVLGKAPPIYHFSDEEPTRSKSSSSRTIEDRIKTLDKAEHEIFLRNRLTEFDQAILEQMEI